MSKSKKLKDHPFFVCIGIFATIIGVIAWFVSTTGLYMSYSEIKKNYITKVECEKRILNNSNLVFTSDTSNKFIKEEKAKLNSFIEELEKEQSKINRSPDQIPEQYKIMYYNCRLDVIYGQLKILEEVLNNRNIFKLKDSLTEEFYKTKSIINSLKNE